MEHHAADELHVVVYHVPCDFVATGKPFVFPDGLVTFDAYEFASLCGEVAVKLCGSDLDGFVGGEAGAGLAHCGEYDGKVLVELILEYVKYVFFVFVYFVPYGLTLIEGHFLHFLAEFGCGVLVGLDGCGD